MPKRRSIKTSSPSDFEPKRKNPISLGSDSNIDNDLKPLTIGGVPTGLEISNDTIASNVENFVTLKEKTQELNVSIIKGNRIPSLGEPQIIFQNANATDNSSGLWLNVFTDGTTFLKANDGQFAMAGTLMSFIVGDDSGEDFLIKSGTFTSNVDIFKVDNGGSVFLKEQANSTTDETAFGQLWVKNDTPNNLYFTNDAGNDVQITNGSSLAGGSGGTQCWTFTLGGYMLNNNSSTNYYTSFYTNYFYWLNTDSSPTSIAYTDAYTYNYKAPKAGVLTKICVTARATRTDPFKVYVYKAAPATGDTSTSATLIGTSDTITPPATNQLVVVDTTISSSNTFSAGDALYVWLKKDSTSGTQSIYFTITIQGDYS